MTPSLSIIVPTCGRPTLERALRSITTQTLPGDQLLVQWDNSGDWGGTARNRMIASATGDWLMFLDDDDVFTSGALARVRQALTGAARVPHVFRVEFPDGRLVWDQPGLVLGNVTTQGLAIPNDPGKIGKWSHSYQTDFDFLTDTVRYHAGVIVWREEIVARWRPVGITFPEDVAGWLTEREGNVLAALASGAKVLEIGTYAGRSAICMAQKAHVVHCCDTFDGRATPAPRDTLSEFIDNLERFQVRGKCVLHVGDNRKTVPALRGGFGLTFIDADHGPEAVAANVADAIPLLAPGGILAFHDYANPEFPDVARVVDRVRENRKLSRADSLAWFAW